VFEHATHAYKLPFSVTAQQIRGTSSAGTRRTEGSTKAPKRKANGPAQTESEQDSESDAFEDVPMKDAEEELATPDKSDQDTEEEAAPTPPPKPTVRRAIGGKAKKAAPAAVASKFKSAKPAETMKTQDAEPVKQAEAEVDVGLPPRRELPFAKRKAPAQKAAPAPVEDDSETDDEL
jgi:hypothetical protein